MRAALCDEAQQLVQTEAFLAEYAAQGQSILGQTLLTASSNSLRKMGSSPPIMSPATPLPRRFSNYSTGEEI